MRETRDKSKRTRAAEKDSASADIDQPVYLEIVPVCYSCEQCDDGPPTTEQHDWVDRNASVTKGLEDSMMRNLINNSTIQDVSIKLGLGYKVIQATLDRLVTAEVDWSRFPSLDTLGIDEIALRKGHDSYLTIVSVRQEDEKLWVVAVIDGRGKAAIKSFLESIPSALRETVKTVCTDMYDGYVYAALEVFGSRAIVVDRYHVAKLYRKPLDTLRVKEMASLKAELDEVEYAKLDGMMWILRKQHECLSADGKSALKLLYYYSPLLKKAHRYALKLTGMIYQKSKRFFSAYFSTCKDSKFTPIIFYRYAKEPVKIDRTLSRLTFEYRSKACTTWIK